MKKFEGKKLLVLGNVESSVDIITYAQTQGAYVYVLDNIPAEKSEAKQCADENALISAFDLEGIYKYIQDKNIDGVYCGPGENLLQSVRQVAEKFNLPCYFTKRQWDILQDKRIFKDLCNKYSVPTVEEFIVDFRDKSQLKNVKLPVVVKPVDSSASRGISVCHTYDELKKGIKYAMEFSNSKKLIIERYMTSEEVCIYYTIQNGNPIFTAMCDRYTNNEQKGLAQLPTCYVYPSKYIQKYINEVDNNVKEMILSVGIENAVLFLQAFIDENGGVRIYEAGYRISAAQEHFLINGMSGIDTVELMVNYALTGAMSNEDVSLKLKPDGNKLGCKLSPLVSIGKIAKISGLDDIERMPEVVAVRTKYVEGDTVEEVGTLRQIFTRIFIVVDDKEKLKDVIDRIYSVLKVEDGNGNSMLLRFFDTNLIIENY